ncbi:MAG: Na/Pi cotransporter family protein, partial [Erysipelotrichaceae bacterium]|nr:Na/Pi cotransporter family protein [Erysipelotrichaceae bacterium]
MGNFNLGAVLGGFGLFMFGIKFMGDGLKAVAGDKLREYIDKYTSKPIMAILVGAAITVLVQSSGATTAITIGLVRAGLMKLEQAAGIVIGANIGTTFTVFLMGLNVSASALYFVFVGSMIISFCKRKKLKNLGEAFLGLGLMFYGLKIMGDALIVIKDLPQFESIALALSKQPILSLLAGTIMTAILHSSAGTIGIVQKIYEAGGMSFMAILPFVYGSNIGTTITGIVASLGGSLTARRTAALHTLFNCAGTVIGMIVLKPFANFILSLNLEPAMQIAVTHIMFNVATTALFFPFLNMVCQLIRKIVPGEEPERIEIKVDELDGAVVDQLPSVSLGIAQNAAVKMSTIVDKVIKDTLAYIKNPNEDEKDILSQNENLINSLDTKITSYLTKISQDHMTSQDTADVNMHLQVVKS